MRKIIKDIKEKNITKIDFLNLFSNVVDSSNKNDTKKTNLKKQLAKVYDELNAWSYNEDDKRQITHIFLKLKVTNLDIIKTLCTYLEFTYPYVDKKNNQNQKYETMVSNFYSDVSEDKIKKQKLVKHIVLLEIFDLDIIEAIYNYFGYPFDYKGDNLSDIYDAALRVYIDEYDGIIEDIDGSPLINASNLKKYEIIFKVYARYYSNAHKEDYKIIENSAKIKNFLIATNVLYKIYYTTNNLDLSIFYDDANSGNAYKMEEAFGFDTDEDKKLFDNLKYVILIGLLHKIYVNSKETNLFRTVINFAKKSYPIAIMIDCICDTYSYDRLNKPYAKSYLDKHELVVKYFTGVLTSLQAHIKSFNENASWRDAAKISEKSLKPLAVIQLFSKKEIEEIVNSCVDLIEQSVYKYINKPKKNK